jgi:hypothetical protein
MRFVLAASLCFAGLACHCPEPVELIQPAEVCIVHDNSSEVGLSERGCVGNPVVFVAENAVWWPYKVIATPLSGASQGVVGAFSMEEGPVVGVLLAPVGLVMGFTIGLFNGLGQQPDVIEANDSLLEAFSYPWISDQEIWKTSTPPSGTWYGKSSPVRR